MAGQPLPKTITVLGGSTMTFYLDNGIYYEITRYPGPVPGVKPFAVPAHWHDYHDELFTVLEGEMEVYIGSAWQRLTPENGEVRIPAGVVHAIRSVGVPMAFREGGQFYGPLTDQPEAKAAFFRDLFGPPNPSILHIMRVFYDGDTYPQLGYYAPRFVGYSLVNVLGGMAKGLGYKRAFTVEDVKKSQ